MEGRRFRRNELFAKCCLSVSRRKKELTNPVYFDAVVDYIKKYGAIKTVELSTSILGGKTSSVTYTVLDWNGWEITVSASTPNSRIYMHRKGGVRSSGNLLKENESVSTEVTSPFKNPKLREKKRVQIVEGYKELITLALADDKTITVENSIYTYLEDFYAKQGHFNKKELSPKKEEELIHFLKNNRKTYPSQFELPYTEKWKANKEKTAVWFAFGVLKNPFLAVLNSHKSNFYYNAFMIFKDENGHFNLYLRRNKDQFMIRVSIDDNNRLEEVYKIIFE